MPRRYDAQLRHAKHYAQIAARAQNDLYLDGEVLAGLALFDRERAQIDAGWGWAMVHAGDQTADVLLLNYPNALNVLGVLRYDPARERIPQLEAQLAAARRIGQPRHEGVALDNLGGAYTVLGEGHQAIAFHEQSLTIACELGDRRGEGKSLDNLGAAYTVLREWRQAIAFYEQGLTIARELGDRRLEGLTLNNLGVAYRNLGKAGQAIAFYEQGLTIARELGDRHGEAFASWNLGLTLEKQSDLMRATKLMQVYVDYMYKIGHPDAEERAAELHQLRYLPAGVKGWRGWWRRLTGRGGTTVTPNPVVRLTNDEFFVEPLRLKIIWLLVLIIVVVTLLSWVFLIIEKLTI